MRASTTRLAVEALEDRCVPRTVAAYGDFNHNGRLNTAAITSPRHIIASPANPDGS